MHISIFTRYIAKSLITFFLGVVGILTFVIFMNHFIQIMNMAMYYGTSFAWILSSLLNILPDVFTLAAPMAFQIAVLLSLTNMSEQGELIALRAAGFSFQEIIRPMLFCAAVLSLLLVFSSNWMTPRSYKRFMDRKDEARQKITKVTLEPKTFMNLGEWDLYLEDLDEKSGIARQVQLIRKEIGGGSLSNKVNASAGKILLTDKAIGLELTDGQMQYIDAKDPASIIAANFKKYVMSISLTKQQIRKPKVAELTTTKLLRQIYQNNEPIEPELAAEYKVEISMRNVMALSPIILLFLSCPLGFSLGKRTNKGWGMLFSVIIIFSFYLLLTLGVSLGKKFELLAYVAPWLPVVVGLVVAKYLWKKRLNI